jgi:hypothetical protein
MNKFFSILQAQVDPSTNPLQDMTHIGHTMVFMAIMIGVVGVGFRIFIASRKRAARTPQPPYAMPWQPPQPPPYMPANTSENTFEMGVFCPRCGVRGASTYCITCGYDLQTVMGQVHNQFTGNRT